MIEVEKAVTPNVLMGRCEEFIFIRGRERSVIVLAPASVYDVKHLVTMNRIPVRRSK